MKMTNNVYDVLKLIAQIILPAVATFVVTICSIWGLPYGEAISGTIIAIDTLLGACLQLSTNKYNKEGTADE